MWAALLKLWLLALSKSTRTSRPMSGLVATFRLQVRRWDKFSLQPIQTDGMAKVNRNMPTARPSVTVVARINDRGERDGARDAAQCCNSKTATGNAGMSFTTIGHPSTAPPRNQIGHERPPSVRRNPSKRG